jgi:hypothetical protein
MADEVAAPVVIAPTPTDTPVPSAKPVDRAARRAATLATMSNPVVDPHQARLMEAKAAEKPPTPAVEPPKATDAPAVPKADDTPVSPQLAALAKKEAQLRAREAQIKDQQATWEKERAAKEASGADAEQVAKLFREDIGALAEKQKLTKEQRIALAEELWLSAHDPSEVKPELRERALARKVNVHQLSAEEQVKAELAKRDKEFADYKAEVAAKETAAQQEATKRNYLEQTTGGITEDAFPHVAAIMEADAKGTQETLWEIACSKVSQDPSADVSMAAVVGEYEKFLATKLASFKKIYAKAEPAKPAPKPVTEPITTSISARAAAVATPVETTPVTRAERRAAALRKIASEL